nr:hypothetical protein [Tanacetum cinerariifolium]
MNDEEINKEKRMSSDGVWNGLDSILNNKDIEGVFDTAVKEVHSNTKFDCNSPMQENKGNNISNNASEKFIKHDQNNSSYVSIVKINDVPRELDFIPTIMTEYGSEVVVFDEDLVKKGSERWCLTICGQCVGYDMHINELSELKKITALLAKAFNRRKFYSKSTNKNLRTSPTSQSANKKQEFVKTDNKKVEKKDDEKKQNMSRVKCYNCKKEGHFAKDFKKVKVKDYEYYKTKMLLAKKDKDEQVLLAKDQAWMESSSDFDQEINANMVFMAQIKKVLFDSEANSSSADEKISEIILILNTMTTPSFFSNSSQVPVTQSPHSSQNTHDESRTSKWEAAEDVALMSAYVMVSKDATRGKNQKRELLWARVKKCYDETRAENPERLGIRNENQMKGRVSRLNTNAQRWISAYQEAYRQKRSGMSQHDIEREAHIIYEQAGKGKFFEYVVFNEVMCKHPKWDLQLSRDTTRTRPGCEEDNEESGEMIIRDRPHTTRRRNYDRERKMGEKRLMQDYFVDRPTYDEATFGNRLRMRRPLFLRIVDAVTANDVYFQQRHDCTGRKGLSPLQKCTGAMRVLAYGTSADAQDEYLRMSETVTRNALTNFVAGVISCFGQEYLRKPNKNDLARLLHVGEERGFPGMIWSIDCMHWQWKNFPTAWAGQYAGRSGKPTIILEAVASYDLWICHAFFGTPGSCNDINVLHRSPLFDDILSGQAPNVSYTVNGRDYNMAYYLTDCIYPSWAAFVKSITSPQLRKHKLFAQQQEAVRKDVEREFGVLQARFAFLRHPCLVWDKEMMGKVMS